MRTSMDMLNGSLWDKIFKFSMPVAATAILEQFFTATDVVIAGGIAYFTESSLALIALPITLCLLFVTLLVMRTYMRKQTA